VDSVPASTIALLAPFTDSPTDLVGSPRALNGSGTCLPGVRDKGAIELTGHRGVVPKPVITGPSHTFRHVTASFTGKAPNLPASVHPTFKWHSSDGASATGNHFSHRFRRPGRSTVSLTVTGSAGCSASVSKAVTVFGADKLSHLNVSPDSFKPASSGGSISAAKTGTTVSYQGSAPATTTFTILRRKAGHLVTVGTFNHQDGAGHLHFHFTGRANGQSLPKGSYHLKAVPSNPAGRGRAVSVSFTITG
jgi:hypothetical protein